MSGVWCTVNWELHSEHPANASRKTRLYHKLFGRKVVKDGREYFYDGVLEGFKGRRRVRFIDYERHSPGVISVPKQIADTIARILAELKIDHRIIQYNKAANYFMRTYELSPSDR